MGAGWYQVAGWLGVAPAWRQMSSTTASRIAAGRPVGSTTYPSASRAPRAATLASNHVLRPVPGVSLPKSFTTPQIPVPRDVDHRGARITRKGGRRWPAGETASSEHRPLRSYLELATPTGLDRFADERAHRSARPPRNPVARGRHRRSD